MLGRILLGAKWKRIVNSINPIKFIRGPQSAKKHFISFFSSLFLSIIFFPSLIFHFLTIGARTAGALTPMLLPETRFNSQSLSKGAEFIDDLIFI